MRNNINTIYLSLLWLLLFLSACEKQGEMVIKPVKAHKTYTMEGFALQPLEQYFDGVKVRDLYGQVSFNEWEVAFDKDEIEMELKIKGTGETVYQHKFNVNDASTTVPKFYFDGAKFQERYNYPDPVGNEYKANFYFDFPEEIGSVDVVLEFVEYYYDSNLPDGIGIAGLTSVPIATNIQVGKWSDYITLNPYPAFPEKTHPGSDFMIFICAKKAGSTMYIVGNDDTSPNSIYNKAERNSFWLEIPEPGNSQGKVQSFFIGYKQQGEQAVLIPKQDVVQLFPR